MVVTLSSYEREFFPINDCELDEYWKDLIEEKNVIDEKRTGSNNRHTLRNKE